MKIIGRPNKTGLSVKLLGFTEYQRQLRDRHRRAAGKPKRQFTGLSLKFLGAKNYRFAYRFLLKSKQFTPEESRNPHKNY